MHEKEYRIMRFQAGLKGIDLDGRGSSNKFNEVKERVQKKMADERSGTESEAMDFAQLGIEVESE
jgi:hypothetical protein